MDTTRHAIRRLVVKVGASVLTDRQGRLNRQRVIKLVEELATCGASHREVILVSSGAIACGMAALGLTHRPKEVERLQACAAIGQGQLMHVYSEACARHSVTVAQVLLTQADLETRQRCHNAKRTLQTLMAKGVVPIVNENDAVAVEEIAFGDNDRLAALVACVVEAQLLVILSDVDGLLERGRVIERIDQLDHAHHALALGASRETTTGGMASKLAAARIVRHSGIPMVIANGTTPGTLTEILAGRPIGTLIAPPKDRLQFHKWWIAFAARQPKGAVVIDQGAVEALVQRGKSLLASGVREVRGRFHAGDAVAIVDANGQTVARGLSNFSSGDLLQIRGFTSAQITEHLGAQRGAEVVHRDHLVLMNEIQR